MQREGPSLYKFLAFLLSFSYTGQTLIVERIHARNQTNCAFSDKSMKLGTWFLDILRSILRNGAISDLTFGDL